MQAQDLTIEIGVEGDRVVLELSHFTRRIGLTPEEWRQLTRMGDELAEAIEERSSASTPEEGGR